MGPARLLDRLGHAFRAPSDFLQRLITATEIFLDERTRTAPDLQEARPWPEVRIDLDLTADPPAAFSAAIQERLEAIRVAPAFRVRHNADRALAGCCYALCRRLRPELVVETGVAHGVTSAYILQALHENGTGRLHSIDFPPYGAGAREAVGDAIPDHLRDRWTLHRGRARRVLPRLLPHLGPVDLFVHDSLHTAHNIRRELALVRPALSADAAVIADDIETNTAFQEFADEHLGSHRVVRASEKEAAFGVGFIA